MSAEGEVREGSDLIALTFDVVRSCMGKTTAMRSLGAVAAIVMVEVTDESFEAWLDVVRKARRAILDREGAVLS